MSKRIVEIMGEVKALAKEYYALTGKPLGVAGEVGEVEAAKLLGMKLADARKPGYDAIKRVGNKQIKVQIKTRRLAPGSKNDRLGKIDKEKPCDTVMLVLLNENYDVTEIREAVWRNVKDALEKPGSKARNEKGQLSVSQFKAISEVVWER